MAQALAELKELSSASPHGEAYIVSILTIGSLLTRGSSIFNTVPPFFSSHSLLFSVFVWRVDVDNQIYITDCLTVNPKNCVLSLVPEHISFSLHFFLVTRSVTFFCHSYISHSVIQVHSISTHFHHPEAPVIDILAILHIAPTKKLSICKIPDISSNYAESRFTTLMCLSTK